MIFVKLILFKKINANINTGVIVMFLKYVIIHCCDEPMQRQHFTLTFIYIENAVKTSFICCLIVTAGNLISPVVFYFSVHGDQQRNNIYMQRCK